MGPKKADLPAKITVDDLHRIAKYFNGRISCWIVNVYVIQTTEYKFMINLNDLCMNVCENDDIHGYIINISSMKDIINEIMKFE